MSTAYIDWTGTVQYMADLVGLELLHPVEGNPAISQAFGVTSITGIKHRGIDFVKAYGTPIRAMRDGWVDSIRVGSWPHYGPFPPLYIGVDTSYGGYGNHAVLHHDKGFSMYAHMVSLAVKEGQVVKAGDVIGFLDSTGISTGNHTHVEFRLPDNATRIDFQKYIVSEIPTPPPPPDTWEAFMADLTDAQKASLVKLADLDIADKTFAPGSPGRSLLIHDMDTYADKLDDAARLRFDRRMQQFMLVLGMSQDEIDALPEPKYATIKKTVVDLQELVQG